MFRSMTAYSKAEAIEKGFKVSIEMKSVNGRNLEINCRLPKSISHRELTIREIIKQNISRGNLNIYINIEKDKSELPFHIDEQAATNIYNSLSELREQLKRLTSQFPNPTVTSVVSCVVVAPKEPLNINAFPP